MIHALRPSLLLAAGVCCLCLFCNVDSASAQIVSGPGVFTTDKYTDEQFELYEAQLNALLKTRRDEEKAYVHEVVESVKAGKLPPKLVQTTYGWVRNKRPFTNYPFVFFEQVLRRQGKKAKLEEGAVPTFDYAIYKKPVQARR